MTVHANRKFSPDKKNCLDFVKWIINTSDVAVKYALEGII